MLTTSVALSAQGQIGSIRGVVSDKDFDAPLIHTMIGIGYRFGREADVAAGAPDREEHPV